MNRQNNSLGQPGHFCHAIFQHLVFAVPVILDEIAVISVEALEKSPDSNVRFCLRSGRILLEPVR